MWITEEKPAILFAPMEGVTDALFRELASSLYPFDLVVTEFLRITDRVPPAHVFLDQMPELLTNSKTRSQTQVQLQILGGDPERLAESALKAVELGAQGIDLNFGCPSPTVNRHDGGATLLKYPHRIRAIVSALRSALPVHIPVSAKLRLGFDTMDAIDHNADQAAEAGAAWITIHGRTKTQGYQPPAFWGPIGRVRKRLNIPVIANGEILSVDDFKRCREQTGCHHFMLGRGVLADPSLPWKIAQEMGSEFYNARKHARPDELGPEKIPHWPRLLQRYLALGQQPMSFSEFYYIRRIKQWLRYASTLGKLPGGDRVLRMQTVGEILAHLEREFQIM